MSEIKQMKVSYATRLFGVFLDGIIKVVKLLKKNVNMSSPVTNEHDNTWHPDLPEDPPEWSEQE